jgi:hypothetical protein
MISPILPFSNSAVPDASAHGLVFADFSWEASEAKKELVFNAVQADENGEMPKIGHSALEL